MPQTYPPGTELRCDKCGYQGSPNRVRGHVASKRACAAKGARAVIVPGTGVTAPRPIAMDPLGGTSVPPQPPDEPPEEPEPEGDEGDEKEPEEKLEPKSTRRTSKPSTPANPAITVRQTERKQITDYTDVTIRSDVTLHLKPSTIALMEAVLSRPEEFSFLEEQTPSAYFDAMPELAMALLDPEYEYELALVKRPRRPSVMAGGGGY